MEYNRLRQSKGVVSIEFNKEEKDSCTPPSKFRIKVSLLVTYHQCGLENRGGM